MRPSHNAGSSNPHQHARHLSLCTKIEKDFIESACQWLGEEFQAGKVSLFTDSTNDLQVDNSPGQDSHNEVASWVKKNGNTLSSLQPEDGNAEVPHEKQPSGNSAEHILKVPSLSCWLHETNYVLHDCAVPAASFPRQAPTDSNESEVTPVSIILQRTAIELARIAKGTQKKDEAAAFRSILASLSDPVFSIDHSLKYTFVNDAFCKLHGKTQDEILGKPCSDLLQKEQADNRKSVCRQVLNGKIINEETSIKIGEALRIFRILNVPIRNARKNVIGLCGVAHDLTDLKQVEEQLQDVSSFQQAVISTAAEGICVCVPIPEKPYLKFTIWNNQFVKLTGYTLDEINQIDWPQKVFKHKLGPKHLVDRIHQLAKGKQFQEEQLEIVSKQGEKKIILASSSQVINGNDYGAIVILARDITEQAHIQEALKRNQKRYRLATRNANISVWEWDIRANTVNDDGNLSRILGYPHQDFNCIEAWIDKIHPDDLPHVRNRWAAFSNREIKQLYLEKRMKHAKGHWVWIVTLGSYTSDDENSRIAIGTDMDITQQKESAARMLELQEQLLKITRYSTIGEIASSLAHNITQHVTAICNYASATQHVLANSKQGENNSTALEYLNKIEQSSGLASSILKGIHTFTHEDGGKPTEQKLGEVIDGALEASYPEIKRPGVHLVQIRESDYDTVVVDRAQIIHVLMSILKNSLDAFSSDKTKKPQITIKTSIENKYGVISIEDNGPGFTQEQALSMFKPLQSIKKSGMGIGLAICKTLIESNSGSIIARGRPGQGAEFTIRLLRK